MKFKILIIMFVFMLSCGITKAKARGITRTGHPDVVEMDFKDEEAGYRLLNQMSTVTINQAYRNVSHKAFGWSLYAINRDIDAWYIKEVVFSKSNNTEQEVKYKYDITYEIQKSTEISASGTASNKVSGKFYMITGSTETTSKFDIKHKVVTTQQEKTEFTITVRPKKKISLLIKGDCSVYTGVAKCYFLGITTLKGTWEYFIFNNESYELYEEDL